MLLLTAFSRFNQWAGPFVLDRVYLSARSAFGIGGGSQPVFDAVFLHPFARLVSIECHHHYQDDSVVKECTGNGDLVGAAERRVGILETHYAKPGVLATHWRAWSAHDRFKRWVRSECLLARHGPAVQKSFRSIKVSPQFQPNKRHRMWGMLGGGNGGDDTAGAAASSSSSRVASVPSQHAGAEAGALLLSKLPTSKQLEAWFDMKDWTLHKDTDATTRAMRRIARAVGGSTRVSLGGALCVAVLPNADGDEEGSVGARGVSNDGDAADHQPSKRSSLSNLRLEELVELSGGHVQECGPLNALCEHYGQYQVYTREYVQKLGEYLVTQQAEASRLHDATGRNPDVILDVGAGDGLLVQLLNDYFDSHYASGSPIQRRGTAKPSISVPRALRRGGPNLAVKPRNPVRGKRRIASATSSGEEDETTSVRRPLVAVATDDGSWRISARAPVERLSVEDALEKYAAMPSADDDHDENDGASTRRHRPRHRPRVTVLCSWMPMGLDWTARFRRHEVDEYVLVGECDDGQCGHNWETWGNPHFRPDDWSGATDNDDERDGSVESNSASTERREIADSDAAQTTIRPPHVVDGYERRDLDFLAPHQFSRYDSRVSKSGRTVSFRRRRGAVGLGVAVPD
jgi:hypothetical protein